MLPRNVSKTSLSRVVRFISINQVIFLFDTAISKPFSKTFRGHRDHDRMVVGLTTTNAIGAYHHWCCGFDSRSGRGVQYYVKKFGSDLWQVGGFLRVLHQLKWPPRYNWNIIESGVKHHKTKPTNKRHS